MKASKIVGAFKRQVGPDDSEFWIRPEETRVSVPLRCDKCNEPALATVVLRNLTHFDCDVSDGKIACGSCADGILRREGQAAATLPAKIEIIHAI